MRSGQEKAAYKAAFLENADACQPSPCNSQAHADAGSCVDLPPPSLQYACTCMTGWVWDSSNMSCADDCTYFSSYCRGRGNGSCLGGVCGCTAAWAGNACQFDADGCQSEPCSSTAHAVNGSCADVAAPGTGYTCNCSQGYAWDSGTAQCIDADACQPSPCNSQAHAVAGSCVDLPAPSLQYACNCSTGWTWDSSSMSCADLNACQPHNCSSTEHAVPGSCADLAAPSLGYNCSCQQGYSWNASDLTCVEGSSNAFACPTGYALDSSALNATSPNRTTCCRFVPTCGLYNHSGASYPCPPGFILDSSKAAATAPNDTRCCKAPALGECEVPQLLPVFYSPRGNNREALSRALPMLVVFKSAESRDLYCPASNCSVRLAGLPMFSAAPSSNPAGPAAGDDTQVFLMTMTCFTWNALACEVGVPLASQGRWSVALVPAVNSTDMYCDRTTLLPPAVTERAADMASTATALSAAASAFGATAAATATGAGGSTSLIRSLGHTQFLAMSVSMAVPWLPAEYIRLCAGLSWSNLVAPAESVVKLTNNATSQLKQQLPGASGRHLMNSDGSSSGGGPACSAGSAADTAGSSSGKSASARSIDQWFLQNADVGTFQSSNGSISGSSSGAFVVSASGGGNGSSSSLDVILLAGTTRQPKDFTLHDLRMSLLSLAVAVAVATLLQGLTVGAWRLFRLNPDNLPMLVRFPKPQLLMYTLLMVPVTYGAAKLVATADGNGGDMGAGIACIVLLPLPVLAYWAYVLWCWYTDPVDASVKRSRSSIMRAYRHPTGTAAAQEGGPEAAAGQQQRATATLALLGDLDDNPTLIIRDRRSGEDELDEAFHQGTRSSDDGEDEQARIPASRPTASAAGGAASADGMARVRSQRQPATIDGKQQPSGGAQGSADGGGSNHSTRSIKGGSAGSVMGSKSKVLRAGSPAPAAGEDLAPQVGTHRPAPVSFLPLSAEDEETLTTNTGSTPRAGGERRGRPLAEGVEQQQPTADDSEQAALAAAWNAARGDFGASTSGWGGAATGDMVSLTGVAVAGSDGAGPTARQQTWMGSGAPTGQQQPARAGSHNEAGSAGRFLDRFWYMVDDLVGDDRPEALARVRLPILVFYIVNSVQRLLTALFFGFYHFAYISFAQLGVLVALHALFVLYLLAVRPYASKLLLGSDVVAYVCEITILAAALLLRQAPNSKPLLQVLVGCYFVDVLFMMLPELLRYCIMAWQWWQRRRQQNQSAAASAGAAAVVNSAAGGKVPVGREPSKQQQQRGVAAGPRLSNVKSAKADAAAVAAAAALKLKSKE
ncbi:hypothetical protein COO60DRAFT_1704375 [Scenedesmus sp. NREL 46B-D3]|nr:hypothetical protein COO60DRAFT_1704375 [Scenedesmus sp. NREL 46B-D3]